MFDICLPNVLFFKLGALKLGVIALAAKLAAIAGFALAKKLHYFKEPTEYNTYSEYSDYGECL